MKLGKSILALTTASCMAVGILLTPAAQAYEIAVEGDSCMISYEESDVVGLHTLGGEALEALLVSLQESTGASIGDLREVNAYVLEYWSAGDFPDVEGFAGTPVYETARRVNEAAVVAGFNDNEIFSIFRIHYGLGLAVAVALLGIDPALGVVDGSPIVVTTEEARQRVESLRTGLSIEDEFTEDTSELARAHGLLVMQWVDALVNELAAPYEACIANGFPDYPQHPGDGDGTGVIPQPSSGSSFSSS